MNKKIKEKGTCSICGKKYKDFGNNAEPINNERCCDNCNKRFVIPKRIKNLKNKQ